jgi:hypothetical protein
MMDKKTLVMAVKMKDGTNLLGFYYGESEDGSRIVLHKPITIKLVTYAVANKPIHAYTTDPYFQYGGSAVSLPYTDITHHDIASDFFTLFYIRSLSDLTYAEDVLAASYIKFFYDSDIRAAMSNTDSILVNCESEYAQ